MTKKSIKVTELLNSESEVLKRIASDLLESEDGTTQSAHNSHTSGHSSGGGHNSVTAKVEKVLDESEEK